MYYKFSTLVYLMYSSTPCTIPWCIWCILGHPVQYLDVSDVFKYTLYNILVYLMYSSTPCTIPWYLMYSSTPCTVPWCIWCIQVHPVQYLGVSDVFKYNLYSTLVYLMYSSTPCTVPWYLMYSSTPCTIPWCIWCIQVHPVQYLGVSDVFKYTLYSTLVYLEECIQIHAFFSGLQL